MKELGQPDCTKKLAWESERWWWIIDPFSKIPEFIFVKDLFTIFAAEFFNIDTKNWRNNIIWKLDPNFFCKKNGYKNTHRFFLVPGTTYWLVQISFHQAEIVTSTEKAGVFSSWKIPKPPPVEVEDGLLNTWRIIPGC